MSTTRFLLELTFKILDIQTQVKGWPLIADKVLHTVDI